MKIMGELTRQQLMEPHVPIGAILDGIRNIRRSRVLQDADSGVYMALRTIRPSIWWCHSGSMMMSDYIRSLLEIGLEDWKDVSLTMMLVDVGYSPDGYVR